MLTNESPFSINLHVELQYRESGVAGK